MTTAPAMRDIIEVEEEVICPNCGNVQIEMVREGDKYAWECRKCGKIIEGDAVSILENMKHHQKLYRGGGMCRCFGKPWFVPDKFFDKQGHYVRPSHNTGEDEDATDLA